MGKMLINQSETCTLRGSINSDNGKFSS